MNGLVPLPGCAHVLNTGGLIKRREMAEVLRQSKRLREHVLEGNGVSGFAEDYLLLPNRNLPSYAPELNPVEYIWAYWKQHELPNVCSRDFWQLSEDARRTLRRMRRRPRLITAFWKQASLWSE
jgi:transposase